jgi:hypothetical protein
MSLDAGSLLNMEIVNTNGVLLYDQLTVTGNFTKQGDIKLNLGSGVDFTNNEFSSNGHIIALADIFNISLLTSLVGNNLSVSNVAGVIQNLTVTASMIPLAPQSTAPVPVPGAIWLFGSGLIGLLGLTHKRSKSQSV